MWIRIQKVETKCEAKTYKVKQATDILIKIYKFSLSTLAITTKRETWSFTLSKGRKTLDLKIAKTSSSS